MTVFHLKYVKAYVDRHGKRRHYYRRPGHTQVSLPGEPGSTEFMAAYHEAANGPRKPVGADAEIPGSFGALIAIYYQTSAYKALRPITKQTYRNVIEKFRTAHGVRLVRELRTKHVALLLDGMGANEYSLRRVLRILLNLAREREWITTSPMDGMRRSRGKSGGFKDWTEPQIAQYEARWEVGTRQRLALDLLLYTAQRRSDVVVMGRQHLRDGKIKVVQSKTGASLLIPVHARLKASLAHAPADQLTFLLTQYGQPFTPAGFGNWFADAVKEAGLPPGLSAHGLRKASLRRLAEGGCTPHELMAVSGHKNLSEVTLYTAAADQERLAEDAMAKAEARTKVSTPSGPGRQSGQNV